MIRVMPALCWALVLTGCGRGGDLVQGETDATHVDVASKGSGRVDSIYVREGDMVRRGRPPPPPPGARERGPGGPAGAGGGGPPGPPGAAPPTPPRAGDAP